MCREKGGRHMVLMLLLVCVLGDNFHAEGGGPVVCNGELLNVQCTGERWKISFLGTDESIRIHERNGTVHIEGARKTNIPTRKEKGSIYYPNGYEIVLNSDVIIKKWKNIPKKIISVTYFLLLSLVVFLGIFLTGTKYF